MIGNLKEFEKFLKICRKQGVNEATVNGVTIKLGDKPKRQRSSSSKQNEIEEDIPYDGLSPEQLAFYHLGPGDAQ